MEDEFEGTSSQMVIFSKSDRTGVEESEAREWVPKSVSSSEDDGTDDWKPTRDESEGYSEEEEEQERKRIPKMVAASEEDGTHDNRPTQDESKDDSKDEAEHLGQMIHKVAMEKPPAEALPPSRLSLPYKVMKSLDGDIYRNLEFDVWQDTCKEMQKTDYMVFAGRRYFLGDKCQVRLEPKGKYYNAFIQEVGTHSSAITVFIEKLGKKHLVPLTDLKPVNPVPVWNVAAPSRKGDLDPDSRGQRRQRHHRHRYFRKSRGMKGTELLIPPPPSYGGPAPSSLPPRFQPAGHPRPPPPPSPGAMTYNPYAPPRHHHPPPARTPRYGALRSSTHFLNRHLIGTQLTYYHPGRRYYQDYESFTFRSRRTRRQLAAALNKECQFGFPEAVEEPADLDAAISYYQLDGASDGVFPPLPVVKPLSVICSSPSSSSPSSSSSRLPAAAHLLSATHAQTRSVAMAMPAASSWSVNELGEPLCTVVAPPPYSYDPNGRDLPRDCRVLQYYFNLGIQWYHQSCWKQQQQLYPASSPETAYPYQPYTPYLGQEPPLHAASQPFSETGRISHQPAISYPESSRSADGQTEGRNGGVSMESSSSISPTPPGSAPSSALLYPDQSPLPPLPLLHLPYEAPPPSTYLTTAPAPPLPHPAHHPHHSSYHPSSVYWGPISTGGHAPRLYCPAPNPSHVVGYIAAPPPHHTDTLYIPPTM
ncbi:putative bifunctional UDP-N-acetylglucosamine transferase and deubiquitinase ALG13 [Astatotilapia calliptera]|uniref:Tudor domain-containing protein n=1 Tax=Astatotilapia calliptera TaxID=8154 RepID=A0AAX7SMB2_ASTCA|nr:putative bifunctional UDP-N-acetylglucosamine transferase and deubiquitinase ALG13 [Astatotilapia calliptera]